MLNWGASEFEQMTPTWRDGKQKNRKRRERERGGKEEKIESTQTQKYTEVKIPMHQHIGYVHTYVCGMMLSAACVMRRDSEK